VGFTLSDLADADLQRVEVRQYARYDPDSTLYVYDRHGADIASWLISADELDALILSLQLIQKAIKENE
jgi:hypothetical protein